MAALLEDLGALAESYPEIFDTAVRENLWDAAEQAVIKQDPGYVLPSNFGMFSEEANGSVRDLLQEHFELLREVFEIFDLDTEAKRRKSFLNPAVRSDEDGYYVDDFFGHP